MNRWFLVFFVVAIAGLALVIYYDSRPDMQTAETQQTPSSQHHETFGQTSETYFDFHGDVDVSSPESIRGRISEIEERLSGMDAQSRAAIPFYGELMLLYQQLGRQDGAAEASRHIGLITNDPDDWWKAGLLNHQWAQRLTDQEGRDFFLLKSIEAYDEAVALTQNPSLYTDFSIALAAYGNEERAMELLESAIASDPEYFRAFLYAGMILYESDKKDESIAYIRRSIEKADSEDELEMIHTLIAGTSIEI
ncbi:MAG: hypothetical protein LAT84_00725 [Balneolia bacterium]|nr:hypothetical protein [Balneolia bacterium]